MSRHVEPCDPEHWERATREDAVFEMGNGYDLLKDIQHTVSHDSKSMASLFTVKIGNSTDCNQILALCPAPQVPPHVLERESGAEQSAFGRVR